MQFSLYTKKLRNSPRTSTFTTLYRVNTVFLLIDILINITLSRNANAAKCTGISQCLVNSNEHSSGWHCAVRKSCSYSVTARTSYRHKLTYTNYIRMLCSCRSKSHLECSRCTGSRIPTTLARTVIGYMSRVILATPSPKYYRSWPYTSKL
jgi:hypothetical protein